MTAVLTASGASPTDDAAAVRAGDRTWLRALPGSRRELDRLAALRGSGVLATRPQAALDALARTAATLCGVSVGQVNLLDAATVITASSAGWLEVGAAAETPRSDSVCQYTISSPEDVTEIPDLRADPRTGSLPVNDLGLHFYAGASVLADTGAAIGAVCVLDRESRILTRAQRVGLRDLAAVAATLIEQHATAQRLVSVTDRLGVQADTDPLTGLYNRRALESVLANLPPRTAVAMVDLDHFKQLNDRCGHDAGDAALVSYASLFRSSLRETDVAARWGGEEFLLVLDDVCDAPTVLRRLQERGRRTQPATFSAGLTRAGIGEDPHQLLRRVDTLLYRAKDAGRDRIVDDLS